MAKKKELDERLVELKSKIQENKVVIGTDRVLKELKAKKLSKVFTAQNCPQNIKDDIKYYANLGNIHHIELDQDNEELGIFCRKNFFVSVIGIVGE